MRLRLWLRLRLRLRLRLVMLVLVLVVLVLVRLLVLVLLPLLVLVPLVLVLVLLLMPPLPLPLLLFVFRWWCRRCPLPLDSHGRIFSIFFWAQACHGTAACERLRRVFEANACLGLRPGPTRKQLSLQPTADGQCDEGERVLRRTGSRCHTSSACCRPRSATGTFCSSCRRRSRGAGKQVSAWASQHVSPAQRKAATKAWAGDGRDDRDKRDIASLISLISRS